MKYNEKYGRWFTKGGLIYRYDSKQDKLVLCKQCHSHGYCYCTDFKNKLFRVHRAIYETFVGEIPDGYVIDHINTKQDDNRLENLRAVTTKENNNNPLTRKHNSEALKGNRNSFNKPNKNSDFGKRYFEHFGYSCSENPKQYNTELKWFKRKGRCRWE